MSRMAMRVREDLCKKEDMQLASNYRRQQECNTTADCEKMKILIDDTRADKTLVKRKHPGKGVELKERIQNTQLHGKLFSKN